MNSTEETDNLFLLIKSLTKAEKRFFKLLSTRYKKDKGSNYIKLFDVIDKQKIYNQTALMKYFKNSTFMRQPHVAKNYLYSLILQALEHYHYKQNSLKNQLQQAAILYEKGLYDQHLKLLFTVRKKAEKQEDIHLILNTLDMERELIRLRHQIPSHIQEMKRIEQQEQHLLSMLHEIAMFRESEREAYNFHYTFGVGQLTKRNKEIKRFKKRCIPLLLAKPNKLKTTYAKWIIYAAAGSYHMTLGEFQKAEKMYQAAFRLLESNTDFTNGNVTIAAKAINNLVLINGYSGKYDECLYYIQKLKSFFALHPYNRFTEIALFGHYNTELVIFMNRCDYKKALQLIIRTEAVEMKTKVYLEYNKVLFTYNASWVFFICGEFRESLKRINYILNSTDVSEKNYYIPKLARLLQLILFFELKEYTTLGHRIRSLYRYLLKYKKLYPFEKILLNFIRNTLQKSTFYDSSTVKKMFSGLLETLEKTYRENPDKKSIGYDDFINWLESKIQNRPFADVVREKAMAEKGNSISTD